MYYYIISNGHVVARSITKPKDEKYIESDMFVTLHEAEVVDGQIVRNPDGR